MPKHGKGFNAAAAKIDKTKLYAPAEAMVTEASHYEVAAKGCLRR